MAKADIARWVDDAVRAAPVYDLHTHLYPPGFGRFALWGIDELLTYHYLIGETIRASGIAYDKFWSMAKCCQADHVWQTLFVERAPISEACRGVVTVLKALGLDPRSKSLADYREFFRGQTCEGYTDTVMRIANVRTVVMTNDPFDPAERRLWMDRPTIDPRFLAVLRVDPLLLGWPKVGEVLGELGYEVSTDLDRKTMSEVRRFLGDWIDRMKAIYVAVSLPPTWRYPDHTPDSKVIDEALLPVLRERGLPFALMVGVTRQSNPQLRMAGDTLGKADVASLERLCSSNPDNRFLTTFLSRDNQHEVAVAARLQPNLLVFGCWWYLNNPSLIEEITRMRMEMLGTEFVPQHSDARVLDQMIYKWDHSRRIIARVLAEKFQDLADSGWPVTKEEVARTAENYLGGNFEHFLSSSRR